MSLGLLAQLFTLSSSTPGEVFVGLTEEEEELSGDELRLHTPLEQPFTNNFAQVAHNFAQEVHLFAQVAHDFAQEVHVLMLH